MVFQSFPLKGRSRPIFLVYLYEEVTEQGRENGLILTDVALTQYTEDTKKTCLKCSAFLKVVAIKNPQSCNKLLLLPRAFPATSFSRGNHPSFSPSHPGPAAPPFAWQSHVTIPSKVT